jgi:putative ABC transport system permease protein
VIQSLFQDLKFGFRVLRKSPGFTGIAIVTLALGIGANTAMFSMVNAAILRPLPFPNAGRLMAIFHSYAKLNIQRSTVSPDLFDYYRRHATSFDRIAAYTDFTAPQNLTGSGDPERVGTVKATADFFPVLGMQPFLGRVFTQQDDVSGQGRVAVLSYAFWQRRYGSNRDILGKEITLDGVNYTVIGIMPRGFQFPERAELWVPMAFSVKQAHDGTEYLNVIATLRAGVSPQQAEAEMTKITRDVLVETQNQANPPGWSVFTEPMQKASVSDVRTALLVLLAAVGCVLLIACANIANLLLARATVRRKEIAIRTALGASRWRMVRHLLTEGVMLSLAGGALGVLLAYLGLDAMLKLVPVEIPGYIQVTIDPAVLAFAFVLAIATGIIFSAIPAAHLTKSDTNEVLKEAGRTSAATGRHVVRAAIVVAQVALAMVLLVAAGLLIQTFIRIQNADLGFNPDRVLTFTTELPAEKYKSPEQITGFFDRLLEEERRLPGVVSAAITTQVPLTSNMASSFSVEGKTFDVQPHAHFALVGASYFSTLQIPLLEGRGFTDADRAGSLPVAIIDQNAARSYFAGENPIGRKVMFTFEGTPQRRVWREIVGVVESVKHNNPLQNETKGEVFLPFEQQPMTMPYAIVVLRTEGDPMALAESARKAVLSVDPMQPIQEVRTMDEVVSRFVSQPRFNMVLLAIFAGLALLLSTIGIYGVMAYSVTQRTQEFGLRMALGASRSHVLRSVLVQALRIAAIGLVLGTISALAATRALNSLVFGVKTTDPETFMAITALLAFTALLASYIPARRATQVDPMEALRYE